MRLEMLRDRGGIEGIDAQAKVIEIGAAVARGAPGGAGRVGRTMSISALPARSCVSVPCRRSSVQPSTSM